MRAELITIAKDRKLTILMDTLILTGLYFSVIFSHLLPVPLYKLEPMKLFLLITVIHSSRGNALVMAASIPLMSTLVSGHPVFPKNLIIGVELMVFAAVLTTKSFQHYGKSLNFVLALLVSKLAYYSIKALIIKLGLLHVSLFSTSFQSQMQGALIVFTLFWILSTTQQKRSE